MSKLFRRPRRLLAAGALGIALTLAGGATAGAATPTPKSVMLAESSTLHPNGGAGTLIKKLLGKLAHGVRQIVSNTAKTQVKRKAPDWTLQQATNWYCSAWYRYFGGDVNRWRSATQHYTDVSFAWNYCSSRRWQLV